MENLTQNAKNIEVPPAVQGREVVRPVKETWFMAVLWTVLLTLLALTLLSHALPKAAQDEDLYRRRHYRWAESFGLPYKPKGL